MWYVFLCASEVMSQLLELIDAFFLAFYQYHVESERINFVLSSDSHTAAPLEDELDMILPLAHKLPSMLYVCVT